MIIDMSNKNAVKPSLIAAERIDELRKQCGMTQESYGVEVLHCSQGTASAKLKGYGLKAEDILQSAIAFGVSTDYLYGLTDEPAVSVSES